MDAFNHDNLLEQLQQPDVYYYAQADRILRLKILGNVAPNALTDKEHKQPSISFPTFLASPATPPQSLTVEKMIDFLINRELYECRVTISYPSLVRKSYAGERRFFCPPPCVRLMGDGWKRRKRRVLEYYESLKFDENPAGKKQCSELVGYIGTGDGEWGTLDFRSGRRKFPENESHDASTFDYCSVQKFVSFEDQRDSFELNLSLFNGCGIEIGQFLTKKVKVISKRPKKRQISKPNESKTSFIASGSKVAIFNRKLHLPNLTFLHVEDDVYQGSATKWGTFTIHLSKNDDKFHDLNGFLYYGNVIQLVDTATGIALPKVRIRKLDVGVVIVNDVPREETVCQLCRVALQSIDDGRLYLCMAENRIRLYTANVVTDAIHQVDERCGWTIVSAEVSEYRFYEAMGLPSRQISPCPMIDSFEISINGDVWSGTMLGRHFTPDLKIWFGATEAETIFRNKETLTCTIPPAKQIMKDQTISIFSDGKGGFEIPISVVRDDGVIYPTNLPFSYESQFQE